MRHEARVLGGNAAAHGVEEILWRVWRRVLSHVGLDARGWADEVTALIAPPGTSVLTLTLELAATMRKPEEKKEKKPLIKFGPFEQAIGVLLFMGWGASHDLLSSTAQVATPCAHASC
jgi:hypothetical protein